MNLPSPNQIRSHGYTLVEIMVVVAIIGLLASLSIIAYSQHRTHALAVALGSEMRTFRDALEQCVIDTGDYDLAAPAGQLSDVFEPYVRDTQWKSPSAVGGRWIVDSQLDGIRLCVGVVGFTTSTAPIELADRMFDDGNTGTGRMRLLAANKYSCIIEE